MLPRVTRHPVSGLPGTQRKILRTVLHAGRLRCRPEQLHEACAAVEERVPGFTVLFWYLVKECDVSDIDTEDADSESEAPMPPDNADTLSVDMDLGPR